MATRDQLHREVDELSESQVPRARIIVVDEAEDDVVGLPEAWKTFEDGTPQPNWVALLHGARPRPTSPLPIRAAPRMPLPDSADTSGTIRP
jgi:hypothetical protein